jgi:hypothetical protein
VKAIAPSPGARPATTINYLTKRLIFNCSEPWRIDDIVSRNHNSITVGSFPAPVSWKPVQALLLQVGMQD